MKLSLCRQIAVEKKEWNASRHTAAPLTIFMYCNKTPSYVSLPIFWSNVITLKTWLIKPFQNTVKGIPMFFSLHSIYHLCSVCVITIDKNL